MRSKKLSQEGNEEEWVYILSGRGIAEIGDRSYSVEPGDFMGFSHELINLFIYIGGDEEN
ncbi:cupin domain-containing protein [Fischerella sp. PCC 9605]|uniref:cupin domain-containing protein n=1 Tax=Fischerella sp. PCC 9605 TaxID=1173024 RepID=UPI001E54BDE1|nr:cupin domain-containing protein [Fischerella sp. PCC 9605]